MRLISVFLALVPVALCDLSPEIIARPAVKGFSTIRGVCDPNSGTLAGGRFTGKEGTLKACTKKCTDNGQCKGLNFVTDQNICQLFQQECGTAQIPSATQPKQNYYTKGQIECSSSTVGDKFYVAFMANRVAQPKNMSLEIWVTQDKSMAPLTVKIDKDPSMSLGVSSILVPNKEAIPYTIPFTWKVTDVDNGVTIEKKALKFYVDNKDFPFVLYGVNKELYTADAFLGIPSRAMGTEYVANCHWPPYYNCEFAITPGQDDTTVTIILPKGSTRNVGNWPKPPTGVTRCAIPYKGRTYTNGDQFDIKLNEFEVAQIQDPCDLTGTIIISDKPIAVWSGDSRVNVGDSQSRDHQVEQLFSADTWGMDCAAWPTPNRLPGLVDYWVITSGDNDTAILIESNERGPTTYNLQIGESVRFPAASVTEHMRFSSVKQFQAIKYSGSAGADTSIPGDPSMTICIPSDQFGFGYTFITPTGVSSTYTNYMTIVTAKTNKNGFRLNGAAVGADRVTWTDFPNSNLAAGVVVLDQTKQQFRIEHAVKGSTFEAYIYGAGDRESIAYPTGACIQALDECKPTTMFIFDGKDNDCDGVIDEELFDGIDNDLDGLIDEDCYDRKPIPVIADRCPEVKLTQACYGSKIALTCTEGTITILDAHYGRMGAASEMTCGGANAVDSCSNSDATCGFKDISSYMRTLCNGQQQCSSTVNVYSLGDMNFQSPCPICSMYAVVQYSCLNAKEVSFGALTGSNYVASSWLSSSGGSCTAPAKTCSAGGCSPVVESPRDMYVPTKANLADSGRRGWRPATCDKDPWLQVDLGGAFSVGWYAISGCRLSQNWVTSFGISYSLDGVTWKDIREPTGALKVFTADSDAVTVKVCTLFGQNLVARYLRVIPISWVGSPCIHVDFGHNATLQGCLAQPVLNSNFATGGSAGFSTSATVRCDKGWATQSGAVTYDVPCSSDGQWGAGFRPCNKLVTCPDLQIDGGYAVASNTLVGSTARFVCLNGRRLRGAPTITCTPQGTWSPEIPVCEQL